MDRNIKHSPHKNTHLESLSPKVTRKSERKTVQSNHSHGTDDIATVELEQPAPENKTKTAAKRQPKKANNTSEQPVPAKTNTTAPEQQHEAGNIAVIESKAKSTGRKAKRRHEDDNTVFVESEPAVITKKAKTIPTKIKTTPEIQPQSPIRRSGRSQPKTAAVTPRRKRRTKAEIAADKAKKELGKRQLEERAEENNQMIMQMDIKEDIERAQTIVQTVRRFVDLEPEHDTESNGEEFVGYNEVSDGDESESDDHHEDAVKLKEANKTLQKKVEALEMQVGKNGAGKIEGNSKTGLKRTYAFYGTPLKDDVGGKRTKSKLTKKVAFASGLASDWNSRGDPVNVPPKKRTNVQISVGGLDDSDADAVNPFPKESRKKLVTKTGGSEIAKRDFSRKNELVSIVSSDDEVDYTTPHPAAKKFSKCTRHPVPVKVEKRENIPIKTAVAKTKTKRLNNNNVRISDLPEFAQQKWRTTFLPTLYDKLFTSSQPLNDFLQHSDQFIILLQTIINEVFPDIDYEVTSRDSIQYLAYNRVNEKRSSIGSNAIKMIEKHINSLGSEKAAKDWLRWSLRKDGPLFFKIPSLFGSPIDTKDGNYQFPEGRLLSRFVIDLATPLINLRSGSASENGYPKGLIALIMTALERAVMFLSKSSNSKSKELPEFSKDFCSAKVETYYAGLTGRNGVPDARWKELLVACTGKDSDSEDSEDSDGNKQADLSMLDNNRAFVFDFCSPAKSYA